MQSLRSIPSIVDLSTVHTLHIGLAGPRLNRFQTQMESSIVNTFMESRADHPVDDCCGWLEKLGGANGGRKGWQKRWFVLQGTLLFYFTQPNEPSPRGGLNLTGAVIGTVPENEVGLVLTWNDGQPDRELRANSEYERDRWIFMIRKALRLDRLRAGRRPQGALGNNRGNNNANAPVPAHEIAPPVVVGLPPVPYVCLSFELNTVPNAIKTKGAAAFVCGSFLMLDRLYTGIFSAMKDCQRLTSEQIMERINDTLEADPHNFAARTLLAYQQEENKAYDDALQSVEQALQMIPHYASACKLAGRLYFNHKKDYEKALPLLRNAVSLSNFQDTESLVILGKTYLNLKNNRLAVGCFETVLSLDPKYAEAHVFLASAQILDNNNVDEAINHLRIALKIDPQVPEGQKYLAEALYKANKFDEALDEYKVIYQKDTANVSVAEIYSDILMKLDRHAAAIEPLTTALAAKPTSDDLSLALARAYYKTETDRYPPVNTKNASTSNSSSTFTTNASSTGTKGTVNDDEKDGGDEDGEDGEGEDEGDEDEEEKDTKPVVAPVSVPSMGLASLPPPPPSSTTLLPPPPSTTFPPPAPVTATATVTPAPANNPLTPLPDPILSGVESADKLSSYELLDAADALIVNVLSRNAASAHGNILCGLVYERLAELEGREVATNKADKLARGEPLTEQDDEAGSGWTVEHRLDAAKKSFTYVTAAFKTAEYAIAPLALGRMAKTAGKWDEAIKHLTTALERDSSLAEATDLLNRCKRLAAGQPEFPPVERSKPKTSKNDEVQFADMGGLETFAVDSNMTADERKAAYFAHLRAEKKRKQEEEEARETAKLNSMTPEERAEYEAQRDAKQKHEARKDKVLNKQLGQYGGGGRGALALRGGRGRGRGRGGK